MIHLLIGARHRDMVDWCDEHLLHRSEIGRTVFSTTVHDEHHLRGRRGPVRIVSSMPSDPRPFRDPRQPRLRGEYEMLDLAHYINLQYQSGARQ